MRDTHTDGFVKIKLEIYTIARTFLYKIQEINDILKLIVCCTYTNNAHLYTRSVTDMNRCAIGKYKNVNLGVDDARPNRFQSY